MTTHGPYATIRMLRALVRLGTAREDVEYEDRQAGIVTPLMRRQLERLSR